MPDRQLIRNAIWLAVLLAGVLVGSLSLGLHVYAPADVWRALNAFDGSATHHVIRDLRLPRTVLACLVGASLAVAGVLLQTLTRNRLAAPNILGLNAGAALAVVVASRWLGLGSLPLLSLVAAGGALATALAVYGLAMSGDGPMSPARTVLAGITLAGLLSSLVAVVLTTDEATLDELLFWVFGGFEGRGLDLAAAAGGVLALGAVAALAVARPLDVLLVDDDTARTLGIRLGRVRALAFFAVAALTGSAVAVAGPIGFIGLIVPHAARRLAGPGHVGRIVVAALAGALFAVSADIAARYVIYPTEAPVGALTALLGGPLLVLLLRRRMS